VLKKKLINSDRFPFNPCTVQVSWVSGSWIFCQTKPRQEPWTYQRDWL